MDPNTSPLQHNLSSYPYCLNAYSQKVVRESVAHHLFTIPSINSIATSSCNLEGNRADPKARRRKARVCLEPKSSLERTSVQQHWSLYYTALWSSPKSVSLPQAKSSQPNAIRHSVTTVPALDCKEFCKEVGELQLKLCLH